MSSEKVRENRLRRMAERQGLVLKKSRRRDHRALDFGLYALVPHHLNMIGTGAESGRFDLTLDDVEARLTEPVPARLGQGAADESSRRNRDQAQRAPIRARTDRRGGRQGHA